MNVKRVHRLWKREGLKVPKKQRNKWAIGGLKRRRNRATHKDQVERITQQREAAEARVRELELHVRQLESSAK